MHLSILIISYNTRQMTLDCLRSVYDQTQGVLFEVIVVDNASTDGSAEAIAAEFPAARLIQPGRNLGFAAANNLAAQHAAGEWLLLLNPDTVILEGAIQKVLAFAQQHPEASIFGGRTFFADGALNPTSCHGRPTPWSLLCQGLGLSSIFRRSRWFDPESLGPWPRDTARQVDAVTGCFLLIRKALWDSLGGFDEAFFMYGEETDLCLRAGRLGHRCLICPEATLIHHGGKSERTRSGKMVKLFCAKALLFQRHWHPATAWFGVRMLDLWAFTRMAAFSLLQFLKPRWRESYTTWRDIWRRRKEWGGGGRHGGTEARRHGGEEKLKQSCS